MAGHECYHCKEWIPEGTPHDCWTTTPAALTRDLPEDLRDAWERLHETALELGDQRVYASHHSIMFARKVCYAFVRPKRTMLELCLFLARRLNAPQVRRATPASRTRIAHIVHLRHRDEVEAPITDWLREAYEAADPDRPGPLKARSRSHTLTSASPSTAARRSPGSVKGSRR